MNLRWRCWFGLRMLLLGCQTGRPFWCMGNQWNRCKRCGWEMRLTDDDMFMASR